MARITKSAAVAAPAANKAAAKAPAKRLTAKQLQAALQAKLDADSDGLDDKASKAAARKAAKDAAPKAKATPKAKAAPVNPDIITASGPDRTMKNPGKLVVTAGDQTIMIDGERLTKQLSKLTDVGCSMAALQEYLAKNNGKAVLAKGVDSRTNPHCSKAVADAAPVRAKASKAARPAKAATTASRSKADGSTPFTVLVALADCGVREGTDRYERFAAVQKCKTLAEALAAKTKSGKAIAMDNIRGMEKRGHVKLG